MKEFNDILTIKVTSNQIDVSNIMKEIKDEADKLTMIGLVNVSEVMYAIQDNNYRNTNISFLMQEMQRTNEFIANTGRNAMRYASIGDSIRADSRKPKLIQKILILYKRVLRKSLRFQTNDQIIVNTEILRCIKATSEHNEQLLKIISAMQIENKKQ